jgi:shikimate kinase/3-dehydroquinate synthase
MMGSGKSTVGALLADRTGWPFHDNDALLRELFGATPREILAAGDEASLLAAEVQALGAGLARPAPAIVGAAGGTIVDAAAREVMATGGIPIWLRITAETILRRSAGDDHRPWPDADREGWISRAMAVRHDLYAAVADLTLDADSSPPSVMADRVLAHVRAGGACPPLED